MKKTLSLLLVLIALTCHAGSPNLKEYCSGAWWDTKVDFGRVRAAGEIRLWFYDDKTAAAEFFFNGNFIQTGAGKWSDTSNLFKKKVLIVMTDGQVIRGTWDSFKNFTSGTYVGGGDTGKWQAIPPP